MTEVINQPLVSIIVITYNSSKFVLETLESAKLQTYQNIELIVSDDCSTDDTVEICRKWIKENKERFVRTDLITVEKNTGISANLNRGCKASKGTFIKPIAGDDYMESELISIYSSYLLNNPEVSLVFCQSFLVDSESNIIGVYEKNIKNEEITFNNQFNGNMIYTPTILFTREIYEKVNGYDENLKIEDIDFYLKILYFRGVIHFIKQTMVSYRIHDLNISSNTELMLKEQSRTLHKYRNLASNYKANYLKFSKSILYSYKIRNKLNFFKTYKILRKGNKFIFLVFFDLRFWVVYFFKKPIKKLINHISASFTTSQK